MPFDVCEPVLRTAGPELAARYPGVRVDAVVGDFERHLGRLPMEGTTLVAFLGGTIGNFTPPGPGQVPRASCPTSSRPATGCCSAPTS